MDDGLVDLKQALEITGMKREALRHWISEKVLPIHSKADDGRGHVKNLFKKSDVLKTIRVAEERRKIKATKGAHIKQLQRDPLWIPPLPGEKRRRRSNCSPTSSRKPKSVYDQESPAPAPKTQEVKIVKDRPRANYKTGVRLSIDKSEDPRWAKEMRQLMRSFR